MVTAGRRSGLVQSLRISVAPLNISQPAGAAAAAAAEDSGKDAEAEEVWKKKTKTGWGCLCSTQNALHHTGRF